MPHSKRLITCFLLLIPSWYAMEAVHEFGHVLHAWWSGGTVIKVSVPLWGISCTHVDPNPHPDFVVWGGPVWGVIIPLVVWLVSRRKGKKSKAAAIGGFFAGYCGIANGLYLGLGWIDRVGDAGDLLRHGVSFGWLIAFGVVSTGYGLLVWHQLTKQFPLFARKSESSAL